MTRAVRAVVAGGLTVRRIEVDKQGKIAVITTEDLDARPPPNDWDDVQ